jgi:hypothetical protein
VSNATKRVEFVETSIIVGAKIIAVILEDREGVLTASPLRPQLGHWERVVWS